MTSQQPYIPELLRRSLIRQALPGESTTPQRKRICVLFADLRDFSEWSPFAHPAQIVNLFELVSEWTVQTFRQFPYDYWKLLGDGIMLVWEANDDEANTTDTAIKTAIDLHKQYWHFRRRSRSQLPIGFGIAICGGHAIKYESDTFFHSVVITDYLGSVVNLAARLQSIAQPGQVIVNDEVRRNSKDHSFTYSKVSHKHVLTPESQDSFCWVLVESSCCFV